MSGDEKLPTWWMTDESTDPADKEDRWYYGKFHIEPYTHIPKKFQKEVVEKSYADKLQAELDDMKKKFDEANLNASKVIMEKQSRLERAESLLWCLHVEKYNGDESKELYEAIQKHFAEVDK